MVVQDFNCGLEIVIILRFRETVVQAPADDWRDDGLNADHTAKVNTVLHEAEDRAIGSHDAVP